MALQQSLTIDATGTAYSEAYFRIMRITIDTPVTPDSSIIFIDVQGFANATARANAKIGVWNQSFSFPVSQVDFDAFASLDAIKTALYNLLKTTDYFEDAIDV